jgi:hypothetical protein
VAGEDVLNDVFFFRVYEMPVDLSFVWIRSGAIVAASHEPDDMRLQGR